MLPLIHLISFLVGSARIYLLIWPSPYFVVAISGFELGDFLCIGRTNSPEIAPSDLVVLCF